MGQFSWLTCDTEEQVFCDYPKETVYCLVPEEFGGKNLKETDYEGYGVFGGRDVYALIAQWNRPESCKDENGNFLPDKECRGLGIDIACYDEDNAKLKYPIKIASQDIKYESAGISKGDPNQGWHYEDDDEEDWYF